MLYTPLLHPEVLSALARAGHGSRVLIADGNYPVTSESPTAAQKVFLNLRRGLVTVTDVLETLKTAIPIESAMVMSLPDGKSAAIHIEFQKLLPDGVRWIKRKRFQFYAEAKSAATTLVIATGEERRFANLLLTIGVIRSATHESADSPRLP
ncbi:MAG TPA: RbsD/FucU family protein [Verrucomicrobiae bacterium]|nr:RbsD/FucU family protein [Verrucomicrobiae bacterium]